MHLLIMPFLIISFIILVIIIIIRGRGGQWRRSGRTCRLWRSDLEIPEFGAAEECLKLHRTGEGGRIGRLAEAMDLAPVAPHALGTGTEIPTPNRRTAVAGDDGQSIDGRGSRGGQGHVLWLEKVELSDRGQQTPSLVAVDLVSEQVARQRAFLNGVLAFSTDEHTVPRVVLEQIT